MANTLIQAYLDLPLAERNAALVGLIHTVSKDERSLKLMRTAISDTLDPLNRLPVELVIQIFDHLHPFAVWSARRTCQRWKSLLSSAQIVRNALNRFATHHPADSALDTIADGIPSLSLNLRHILALRLARPFTYVSFPGILSSRYLRTHQRMPLIQLRGKYLAHLPNGQPEDDLVTVRNLVSGDTATFRGQAREMIMGFALSTEIVAFVTYTGTMYVASLVDLTASPSPVRLPSSSILEMAANGGTVACLLAGSCEPVVIVYNFRTRKSNSFTLEAAKTVAQQEDPKMLLKVCTMTVNEDKGTIDIAAVACPSNEVEIGCSGLRVVVFRYSVAGEYATQTAWDKRVQGLRTDTVFLGPLQATGERGVLSMEVGYAYRHLPSSGAPPSPPPNGTAISTPIVANLTLLYDEDNMSLKAIDWIVSRENLGHINIPRPKLWKDRLYRARSERKSKSAVPAIYANFRHETEYENLDVGPHALSRLSGQPMSPPVWVSDEYSDMESRMWPVGLKYKPKMEREGHHEVLAINDTFIVTEYTGRWPGDMQVLCFDERVKLHGAESTKLWEHGAKSRTHWDPNHLYTLPSST